MIDVEMLRPVADEMLSGLTVDAALKRRMLCAVDFETALPVAANEMLGGLTANASLRHRILMEVERKQGSTRITDRIGAQPGRLSLPRLAPGKGLSAVLTRVVPAVGMAAVMTVMIGLGMQNARLNKAATDPSDLGSYMMSGSDTTGGTVPQYRSLFADEGANPSLVGINGRFYRMLNVVVPQDAIGSVIAEVQEYTDEPSLAATVGVISNVVGSGTPIHKADGISHKTACIVEVDGVPRLFQRVGYASGTTIGSELLEDTLDIYGHVAALELSGVGVIHNADNANQLIYMLSEFASYHGNDIMGGSQALTIYLDNGLSLQLMVDGDVLSGCGAWSCPEFFDAFTDYLGN